MKKTAHFRGMSPISRRLASAHVPSARTVKASPARKVSMGLPMSHATPHIAMGHEPSQDTLVSKLAAHANSAGKATQRIDYEQQKMAILEQRLKDLGIDLDDQGGMQE